MRVTTALKRLLRLPGASIRDVSFASEGVIVTVRLRRRRRICSRCGQTGRQLAIHEWRRKRWRHLDLGGTRCFVECELRHLRCPDCGVHLEAVAWARPGSGYTRDFEDLTAFLAQQMAKTPIARLLRIGWETVGRIVERAVAEGLDEGRLAGLVAIGVDEISYRRGQRYLTCVADHAAGAIVWAKPGRDASLLKAPERQSDRQLAALADVQHANRRLYRAFLLKEELRALYHLPDPALAPAHLAAWLAWASRSKLKPFVKLARTLRQHQDGILAAVRLGLTNGRLEGLNSKVRLISHRSYGFHGPDPLIALIYLCAGGINIDPPFTPNS